MTTEEALTFVEERGVVLVSGRGPAPRLTEAIVNEPIKGSWWAHPRSHDIFAILQTVTDSEDILVCRLVGGKVTLVHRRLWPALVRLAERFLPERVAKVCQEHTNSGHHATKEIPFPEWVPAEVNEAAKRISQEAAVAALGPLALVPNRVRAGI